MHFAIVLYAMNFVNTTIKKKQELYFPTSFYSTFISSTKISFFSFKHSSVWNLITSV